MCHGLPEGGKSECTVTSHLLGAPGTVPVGGVSLRLCIEYRGHGLRVVIKTLRVKIAIVIR